MSINFNIGTCYLCKCTRDANNLEIADAEDSDGNRVTVTRCFDCKLKSESSDFVLRFKKAVAEAEGKHGES